MESANWYKLNLDRAISNINGYYVQPKLRTHKKLHTQVKSHSIQKHSTHWSH